MNYLDIFRENIQYNSNTQGSARFRSPNSINTDKNIISGIGEEI